MSHPSRWACSPTSRWTVGLPNRGTPPGSRPPTPRGCFRHVRPARRKDVSTSIGSENMQETQTDLDRRGERAGSGGYLLLVIGILIGVLVMALVGTALTSTPIRVDRKRTR